MQKDLRLSLTQEKITLTEKRAVGKEVTLPDGSIAPLSAAYSAAGFLFTSGQLALDETGKLHAGDHEKFEKKDFEYDKLWHFFKK